MSRNRILILSIFILSLSLRFILSLLNYEANDNHVEVVEWIINHHSLPDADHSRELVPRSDSQGTAADRLVWLGPSTLGLERSVVGWHRVRWLAGERNNSSDSVVASAVRIDSVP